MLSGWTHQLHIVLMLQGTSEQASLPQTLYRGVSWDVKKGQWQVSLQVKGRKRLLGHFETEAEAARGYDAAVRVAGATHPPNFPNQVGYNPNMRAILHSVSLGQHQPLHCCDTLAIAAVLSVLACTAAAEVMRTLLPIWQLLKQCQTDAITSLFDSAQRPN